MTKSIKEQLGLNRECESVLDCLYDIRDLDKQCYEYLLDESEAVTAGELAGEMNRDTSTIHRSLDRLREANLITKEQVSGASGGYKYIFYSRDPEEVKEEMQLLLHQWYVQTSQLVDEFSKKYS